MIDISPASFVSPMSADVTDSRSNNVSLDRTSLGELFALCMAQISKTPSLRDIARVHLSFRLNGIVAIPNPDIYFINSRAMDGSISRSLSLTDALLQVLVQGVASVVDDSAGIYIHHGSVLEEHRVPNFTLADALKIFDELIVRLPSAYKDSLDEFWSKNPQKFLGLPGFLNGITTTHHGVVSDLQAMALNHEVELKLAEGMFSPEEEDRLSNVIHDVSHSGTYTLSLVAPGGPSVLLTSTFVITQTEQLVHPLVAGSSRGTVFLVSPSRGLEKFDSLALLDEAVIKRLADSEERELLLQDMLLRDRALLMGNDAALSGVRAVYSFLSERLLNYRTLSLRHKQIQDFDFTLAFAQRSKEDLAVFLQKVSDIQYLKSFDTALQRHFLSFSSNEQQKAMPHWLKFASVQEKASYLALQDQCLKHERAVSRTRVGLESLETFTEHEIDLYVRKHLGYSVDPGNIFITFPRQSQLRTGRLDAPLKKSLQAFAIEGLPALSGAPSPELEVPQESGHRAWTFEFVERLISELDVRHRYAMALKSRYREPQTQQATAELLDSTLALSALAAKLQHHISDADLELITLLRANSTKAGADARVGSVMLAATGSGFKDLLVFHEKNESRERYVLYAPGAPDGLDLQGFDTWHKLSIHIGRWLNTRVGVRYLADKTPVALREKATTFLLSILEKPIRWQERSVSFDRFKPAMGFEGFLLKAVVEKVEHYLAEMETAAPLDFKQGSYDDRRTLAGLDVQLAAVEAAYTSVVNLKSYREYARAEGKRLLNAYLRKQGINQTIDPETVYVDLYNKADRSVPDFSEYTQLQPLTQFFMQGQSSHNAFHEQAILHSSIGQDLSILPPHAIVKALEHEVGENYIALLKSTLWNPRDRNNLRRRQLYATRLELQMRRAAQSEWMLGRLNAEQYQWLNQLILSVGTSRTGNGELDNNSMHVLTFKRLPVEGVFRFKDFKKTFPEYDLIYTPQAPDGILFRETRSIARSMQSPGMTEYYYGRVRYQDQGYVRAMIDAIDQTSDIRDPLKIDNDVLVGTDIEPSKRITDLEALYVEMIGRMIIDVDNQSVSNGEVLADLILTIVKWTGNVLLIPFAPAALAWSYLHTMIDFARGVVAYATGDRATANTFFAWGMFGMWFGLIGAKSGIKNEPGLIWATFLKTNSEIKLYSKYYRTVREIYQ